jgi:hypothetical protein
MLAIHRRGRKDALVGTLLGFQLGQHRHHPMVRVRLSYFLGGI